MNASEHSKNRRPRPQPCLKAEIDAAALRATLIANTYLEAEIERLTEAISNGLRAGADAQGTSAGEEDL